MCALAGWLSRTAEALNAAAGKNLSPFDYAGRGCHTTSIMTLHHSPAEQNPTAETIQEQTRLEKEVLKARTRMGGYIAAQVLPEGTVVQSLRKELFRSPAAKKAGHKTADRSLTAMTLETGAQVFVADFAASELGQSGTMGADSGSTDVLIYACDQAGETITEYAGRGVERYTGAYGDPEVFLLHVWQRLGMLIDVETY